MTIWRAVAATAASLRTLSPVTPRYTWERVSGYWSNAPLDLAVDSAYVRAATACTFSASSGQELGISPATTPRM